MGALLLGGCGYDVTETTTYRAANWTPEGQIIARKLTLRHGKNLISNSIPMGDSEEIVVMNADGSGEHGLFSVDENMIKLIEMSPLGNYVGYINGNGELKVYTRGGALVGRVDFGHENSVQVLDFSPDETKVYLSFGYSEMLIYSVPDLVELDRNEFGGGGGFVDSVSIVYYDWDEAKMSLYNTETNSKTLQVVQLVPDIYSVITNKVHTLGSNVVYTYELGAASYTEVGFSWGPYEANDFTGKHLSGDGGKVVMGAGGLVFEGAGIHILDVANGGGWTRLR